MKTCYYDERTRAIADLHEVDGYWRIARINVPRPHRRKGHGTALLRQILADADAEGVLLFLEPLPSDPGMSRMDLVRWYQRHGFVWADYGILLRQPAGVTVDWVLPSIYDFRSKVNR